VAKPSDVELDPAGRIVVHDDDAAQAAGDAEVRAGGRGVGRDV
jgi:hypothetical protein